MANACCTFTQAKCSTGQKHMHLDTSGHATDLHFASITFAAIVLKAQDDLTLPCDVQSGATMQY